MHTAYRYYSRSKLLIYRYRIFKYYISMNTPACVDNTVVLPIASLKYTAPVEYSAY